MLQLLCITHEILNEKLSLICFKCSSINSFVNVYTQLHIYPGNVVSENWGALVSRKSWNSVSKFQGNIPEKAFWNAFYLNELANPRKYTNHNLCINQNLMSRWNILLSSIIEINLHINIIVSHNINIGFSCLIY